MEKKVNKREFNSKVKKIQELMHKAPTEGPNTLLLNMMEETKRLVKQNIMLEREIKELTEGDDVIISLKKKIQDTRNNYKKELVKQFKHFSKILKDKDLEFEDHLEHEKKKWEEELLEREYELHEKDTFYPMLFHAEKEHLESELSDLREQTEELEKSNMHLNHELHDAKTEVSRKKIEYEKLIKEFRRKFTEMNTLLDINVRSRKYDEKLVAEPLPEPSDSELRNLIENALAQENSIDQIKQSLLNAGYSKDQINRSLDKN